jgi:hypothetical protein
MIQPIKRPADLISDQRLQSTRGHVGIRFVKIVFVIPNPVILEIQAYFQKKWQSVGLPAVV